MIDTKHYKLLDYQGYANKADAYYSIRKFHSGINGVTTYFENDDGLWYIVQSKEA